MKDKRHFEKSIYLGNYRVKLTQQESYLLTFMSDKDFKNLYQKDIMEKYGVTNNLASKWQKLIRNNDKEEIFNTLYNRELNLASR